ncbi:hypothetical protein QQS21_000622 [Conoideocrella luteorostrata]|uniref:Aminoglycoside phosphotransferase domain-containing protein n=1 Tax=Conoideocrella luteorostrata TaxID=1105319 RepID=A0AAJ0CYF3_9HYPO|nr:hypothetical protein QQS21_000622 [Conoideocrella luteorostrata]
MEPTSTISEDVLTAFGIEHGMPLKALLGGSVTCYLAGEDIVFRPSEDDPESEQVAQVVMKLALVMPPDAPYRISRPISVATDPTRFVYNGWTAWAFVSGGHRDEMHWDEVLRTCRAFHEDIGKIDIEKPEFLNRRMNRFREADLVAWDEKSLNQLPVVANADVLSRIREPLRRLEALKGGFKNHRPRQLIHGDIGGNMLFEKNGQPPGIIDLTFYWRPAGFGEAILVADGLMWHGEGDGLITRYGTDADSIQLLVRALLFRTVAWAIDLEVAGHDSDKAWVEKMLPLIDFDGPVETVCKFVES